MSKESPRLGLGFDIHRLEVSKEPGTLVLGGVLISSAFDVVAHSDGDVLFHALVDALLGALAMGDIGEAFPDTDPAHKGKKSVEFLRITMARVRGRGFRVGNVDANILLERPKLGEHKLSIRENLAHELELNLDCINIKAKTMERLGPIGEGQAVAAQVAVMLISDRDA